MKKLQEEMEARMNRVVKKIGKKDMSRSEKTKIKADVVKIQIDQDTLD
jgi:hypothetical protein